MLRTFIFQCLSCEYANATVDGIWIDDCAQFSYSSCCQQQCWIVICDPAIFISIFLLSQYFLSLCWYDLPHLCPLFSLFQPKLRQYERCHPCHMSWEHCTFWSPPQALPKIKCNHKQTNSYLSLFGCRDLHVWQNLYLSFIVISDEAMVGIIFVWPLTTSAQCPDHAPLWSDLVHCQQKLGKYSKVRFKVGKVKTILPLKTNE